MLVKKLYGIAYAVVVKPEAKKILQEAEYYRFRTHCANVRIKELNEIGSYDNKVIKVKEQRNGINDMTAIFKDGQAEFYKRVPFYDCEILANERLDKELDRYPNAEILKLSVFTNVPKSEQKKVA